MSETMNTKKDIYILGIESSCDETAASCLLYTSDAADEL